MSLSDMDVKTTPLHGRHLALGAKMGPFASYDMPLYYSEGVIAEHEWTRAHAGLFDVSHMGQLVVSGPGAVSFLERITPSAVAPLVLGRAKYSVLTNETGGIIDDLIITRMGDDRFFAVVNAGCKDKDIAWMQSHLSDDVRLDHLQDRALLALQGPDAETVMREALGLDVASMPYMWMEEMDGLYVSRLGYTGEDGFEISVPADQAAAMWDKLCAHDVVKPVGLAARDSLRLEMGYPLYGHDIDDATGPVEAGLSWVIGKDQRAFIGADAVRATLAKAPARMRVGIVLKDKGIAREGAEIRGHDDQVIGHLTSGGFSPTTKQSIAMGYVSADYAAVGRAIFVNVRGRNIAAEIAAMPFVAARTKSMKKQAA